MARAFGFHDRSAEVALETFTPAISNTEGLQHITLVRMDAASLAIDANSFDIVYAPYIISVVPDPVQVAREMRRVCRPGGRIVILNHFRSNSPSAALLERVISPVTIYLGFRSDLEMSTLLANAQLHLSRKR
jgi:phosphatidylethanolamine/phosphatidyl-N-methylethanolamine N-methyltransferase